MESIKSLTMALWQAFGVWYEESQLEAYLWLCISRVKRKGIGNLILKSIVGEISSRYTRAYAKLEINNAAAYRQLTKYGFEPYKLEGSILYVEKFFQNVEPKREQKS